MQFLNETTNKEALSQITWMIQEGQLCGTSPNNRLFEENIGKEEFSGEFTICATGTENRKETIVQWIVADSKTIEYSIKSIEY